MKTKKFPKSLILIIVLILFMTTCCKLFKPDEDKVALDVDSIREGSTPEPKVSPTSEPTNSVNLDDSGLPLPPEIVEIIPDRRSINRS